MAENIARHAENVMNKIVEKLPTVARVLLGLPLLVFGLNGFLQFLPPPPMSGPPAEFLGALMGTGYLMVLVKAIEVVVAVMLLSNRFVPLALTLFAPVLVNIVLFHLVLAPGGYGLLALLVGAELFLAWSYRDAFKPMLRASVQPAAVTGSVPQREALGAA